LADALHTALDELVEATGVDVAAAHELSRVG
jgi:hypothetical protein